MIPGNAAQRVPRRLPKALEKQNSLYLHSITYFNKYVSFKMADHIELIFRNI